MKYFGFRYTVGGKFYKRKPGESSFARTALEAAATRRQRETYKAIEPAQCAITMAETNINIGASTGSGDVKTNITVRRHPSSSPEARFLVTELDKSLTEFYPDWDQLNHPAMKHDNNPRPPPEQATEEASLHFFGQVNDPMEDQETKGELVFFIAFDSSATSGEEFEMGKEKAIGCAALRLFSTPGKPLPAELDPDLNYAELKRMFVLPSHQGRGISKLLLRRLEEYAVENLQVDVIVMETGLRQKASLRLYEGMGYQRRSMFGQYVGADPESGGDSACLEKRFK